MVAILAALLVLGFVLLVLILRTPRSHHLRVGLFVERDESETPDPHDVAVFERAERPELDDTLEIPPR